MSLLNQFATINSQWKRIINIASIYNIFNCFTHSLYFLFYPCFCFSCCFTPISVSVPISMFPASMSVCPTAVFPTWHWHHYCCIVLGVSLLLHLYACSLTSIQLRSQPFSTVHHIHVLCSSIVIKKESNGNKCCCFYLYCVFIWMMIIKIYIAASMEDNVELIISIGKKWGCFNYAILMKYE